MKFIWCFVYINPHVLVCVTGLLSVILYVYSACFIQVVNISTKYQIFDHFRIRYTVQFNAHHIQSNKQALLRVHDCRISKLLFIKEFKTNANVKLHAHNQNNHQRFFCSWPSWGPKYILRKLFETIELKLTCQEEISRQIFMC